MIHEPKYEKRRLWICEDKHILVYKKEKVKFCDKCKKRMSIKEN